MMTASRSLQPLLVPLNLLLFPGVAHSLPLFPKAPPYAILPTLSHLPSSMIVRSKLTKDQLLFSDALLQLTNPSCQTGSLPDQ